jgi:predicted dehydrogenase
MPGAAMGAVRIAVAGAGVMGRVHAAAVRSTPGAVLSALADPAPDAAAVAAQLGVPWFASLDELLARGRPDGVVLATPNTLHVAQALQCLDAGVAVLVEKPVATCVAEAAPLLRAAQAPGARVLVGHHRAHSPIIERAVEVVRSGALGRVVVVTGSALFCKPDRYFDDGPWRREPGGGPILLNLIHDVHNLRLLAGEIVAVQAFASNAVRGFAVEDTVAIGLRFASGALGSIVLSDTAACPRSWEQTSGENPAYARCDDEDCYVVAGTDGSLAVPTMRLRRYARREDRSWFEPFETRVVAVERADPVLRQMAHFAAVVRGEAAPRVSVADAVANLRVTEAVALAARSGGSVDVAAG